MEAGVNLDQSIQLGFSRSLGSTASNEAFKSTMWRTERSIIARQAVLRLAQMKYEYFVPELCKQNAIFQVQAIKIDHISTIYGQTGDIL